MLRGLAALMVVVHHVLENSNGAAGRFSPDWLTLAGAAGVDVFFVISGLIMFHTSFGADGWSRHPGNFLWRRFARIYPLYWLCCLCMIALGLAGFMRGHERTVQGILAGLALVPNAEPILGVAWTLVYEIWFYLVFAALLAARRAELAVIGTVVVIAAFHFGAAAFPKGVLRSFFLDPIPFEFCLGVCVGWGFRASAGLRALIHLASPRFILAAISLAAIALAAMVFPRSGTAGLDGWLRVVGWGLPAFMLVVASLDAGSPWTTAGRSLLVLGNASYSLYLTHSFVMIVYAAALKRVVVLSALPQAPLVVAVTLASIAVGFLVHVLVEKPLVLTMRRLELRWRVASFRFAAQSVGS